VQAMQAGMEACDCASGKGTRAGASAVSCVGPVAQQSATRGHDMEQGVQDRAEAGGSCEHKGEKGRVRGANSLNGEKIAAQASRGRVVARPQDRPCAGEARARKKPQGELDS
jgi:hypothetical protein